MIPIFELKRQYNNLKNELNGAVARVMANGMFTLGSEVAAFEEAFAEYVGTYHAVGVASGTDALTLALKSYDIGPGCEVILPTNSYPSAFGVSLSGVSLRLVDCGEDGNISVKALEKCVTKKTKAVIPVHLYGNPADIIGIQNVLNKKHSPAIIVEDAAQAAGAQLKDGSAWKNVGTLGTIGCFSFYPTKNLGAYGDGGAVVTDDSRIAARLKGLRMYGEKARYVSVEVSGVSRLDEIQAAILRVKLEMLDRWVQRRREIAEQYITAFSHVGDIRVLTGSDDAKGAWHLFVVRTAKRDALQAYLTKHGIGCAIHYPTPIHLTPSFANLGYKKGDFPIAEALSKEVLSLPMYPELTDREVETVIKEVKRFYAQHGK